MYQQTTLPNGLRIVTFQMPHTRSAAVQFFVRVGARNELEEKSGISHFLEHMVFKGTENRPRPVLISEAIEGVGGSLDASTDHEQTSYRALVPSPYFSNAVDVITDMLRRPLLRDDEITRERSVIIEEINSIFDSPGDIVDFVFDELMWGQHPLGRDIAGTKATVRRIKRNDLAGHLEVGYRPDRIVVSVAGNVEHEQVVEEVGRRWGDLAPATNGHILPDPDAPHLNGSGPKVLPFKKRTEQTNFILGVPALPYTDPNRYTQDVLDALLGGGMSSRLFVEIRENRGLAYAVSSFVRSYRDTGAFGVHAAVDTDRLLPAVQGVLEELKRMRETAVSETELRKVKEYIKGHTLLSLERSGYVAHWGGWQELMLGRIETVDDVLDKIESVTPDDVARLSERLFREDRLNLAFVGPQKDAEAVRSALRLN
ncbi:MAG: insulinase family protein [Chloroflexota bacterium]|nr:insulinase family protein [Chloroflexota bacterium]MDQ5864098.1 insulinase family protein [Chloroflexota bacterium]